jgi:hypothetical protein
MADVPETPFFQATGVMKFDFQHLSSAGCTSLGTHQPSVFRWGSCENENVFRMNMIQHRPFFLRMALKGQLGALFLLYEETA